MNDIKYKIKSQYGFIKFKAIFLSISVLAVLVILLLPGLSDNEMASKDKVDLKAVKSVSELESANAAEIFSVESINGKQPDRKNPDFLYNEIRSKLNDPQLRNTLTARQILDTPGFDALSDIQKQSLVAEILLLIKSNALDSVLFMKDFSGKNDNRLSTVEGGAGVVRDDSVNSLTASVATRQQEQTMREIMQQIQDPEKSNTITAAELINSPDVQALPVHLRTELVNNVIGMLSRGEINSNTFLKASSSTAVPVAEMNEEKIRSEITYEQWQSYEKIQARLQGPGFQSDTMISEILTGQEFKTLPLYLRKQLSSEVVKMLEN